MDNSTDIPPNVVHQGSLPNSITRPFRRKCTSGTMAESVKGTCGTCKWMGNFGSRSHASKYSWGSDKYEQDKLDCIEPPGSTMTPHSNN